MSVKQLITYQTLWFYYIANTKQLLQCSTQIIVNYLHKSHHYILLALIHNSLRIISKPRHKDVNLITVEI
jgi:hypothetical protein